MMIKSRILITGGTGLLGKALLETQPEGTEVLYTAHQTTPPAQWQSRFLPLELRDTASVQTVFEAVRPGVVIHTASIGAVDQAQRNPKVVQEVNVKGTRRIVEAAQEAGAFLVQISTNAVFDGKNPPYREGDERRAVNRYGTMKIEAEDIVQRSGLPHLILRPILLYGWPFPGGRGNVVTRWLETLRGGGSVQVADDLVSMPLYVTDCAKIIWKVAAQRFAGTLHVAGPDRIALVDFARLTARTFGFPCERIIPVSSAQLPVLAPRPQDTSFDTTQLTQALKISPLSCKEGLQQMVQPQIPTTAGTR